MWFKKWKFRWLVKAKLDGRITPKQEKKLNKMLADDPGARIYYDRMMELEGQLGDTDQSEENIDVAGEVMQKIRHKNMASQYRPLPRISMRALFNPFPVRFAMVLIAGVLLGSAFTWFFLSNRYQTGTASLGGSMMHVPAGGMSFVNAGMDIKLAPYVAGDMCFLNFITSSADELAIHIKFDDQLYTPVKTDYIIPGGSKSLDLSPDMIRFTVSGKTSFQAIFKSAAGYATPFTVEVWQNQSLLNSKKVFVE